MTPTTRPLRWLDIAPAASAAWRDRIARTVARWREWREARALARLDRYHVRARNEHERHLAKARDVYELERLERDWMRRPSDLWRVY